MNSSMTFIVCLAIGLVIGKMMHGDFDRAKPVPQTVMFHCPKCGTDTQMELKP